MKKSDLLNIISKYNLAGRVNSVRFDIDDEKNLKFEFKHQDGLFYTIGNFKNFDLEESSLGVYDTEQLVKVLSALDDEFEISLNHERNKLIGLNFSDSAVDASFMLGDLSLKEFQPAAGQKSYPDTHVSVELDKETMNRFVKSASALKNCRNFALFTTANDVDVILNYSENNSNRIKLTVSGSVSQQLVEPLVFSSEVVSDIFNANKNCTTGKLEASAAGLLTLSFETDEWNTKYLVPKMQI